MWIQNLLKSLTSTSTRRRPARRPASRLRLEPLEDRWVPSFSPVVNYPVADGVGVVVSADFNGDGRLDLATAAGYTEPKISVLLGNGDGTFQPALTSPGDYSTFGGLAVGDFNGDGKPDLVNEGGVHLGNGDGTFAPGLGLNSTPYYVGWIAAGDLNADGKDDLVGVNAGSDGDSSYGVVEVWLGNGDGTLVTSWFVWGSGDPRAVALADFNGDGKLDVTTGERALLGNGDGTLLWDSSYGLGGSFTVSVADFNGDGKLDQATGTTIKLGHGDGTFHQSWADGGYGPSAVADFNGDGNPDLATTFNDLQIFLGNGDGTLRAPPTLLDITGDVGVAADFNGDGFADLAGNNAYSGYNGYSVLINDGNWPPLDAPSVSVRDATVTDGNTGTRAVTFTVSLSAAYSQAVTVTYATADGTAAAGSDYQAASGTLTIPAGQTTGTITVLVNGDRLAEANETFVVNLSSPTNATIADGQGVGTIMDDEPRVSVGDATLAEGRKGQTTLFTFTVTLSAAYDQAVTMSYHTVNGTAKSSEDYIAKTGTLTFFPGETTKTITIEVKGDSKKEATEYFYLELFGNSSDTLFTENRGLGTILNDD